MERSARAMTVVRSIVTGKASSCSCATCSELFASHSKKAVSQRINLARLLARMTVYSATSRVLEGDTMIRRRMPPWLSSLVNVPMGCLPEFGSILQYVSASSTNLSR